jgi:hypothetical protein
VKEDCVKLDIEGLESPAHSAPGAIVESDMHFNNTFDWATDGIPPKWIFRIMQLMNLGSMGVIMYGYSSKGDVKKRSLELPDISGFS